MEIEKKILNGSDIIFSISNNDIKNFKEIYNIDAQKIFYLPYINKTKYEWNGINSNYIVFIGSMYNANINAVNFINNIALNMNNLNFIIIGNINSMHLKNLSLKSYELFDLIINNENKYNAMEIINKINNMHKENYKGDKK